MPRHIDWRTRGTIVVASALVAAFASLYFQHATAKERGSVTLSVAETIPVEFGVERRLDLRLAPRGVIFANTFVRLRGLPHAAVLNRGHVVNRGTWAISLGDIDDLTVAVLNAPDDRAEITITVVTTEGVVLTEARSTLVFGKPKTLQGADSDAKTNGLKAVVPSLEKAPLATVARSETAPKPEAQPPAGAAPAIGQQTPKRQQSPADRERALRLKARGDEHMAAGDMSAARLFYIRAAEGGLGEAAMALARTYDPSELKQRKVLGLTPDAAAARRWYERALELGQDDAAEHLKRLAVQ